MTLDNDDIVVVRRMIALLEDDAAFLAGENGKGAARLREQELSVMSRLKRLHDDAVKSDSKQHDDGLYTKPVPCVPRACRESCLSDDDEPPQNFRRLGPPPREAYAESEPEPEPRRPVTGPAPKIITDCNSIPPCWGNIFDD